MSFRKKLFKNIIVLGGYSYSTQIISFLSTIILSRLLLPAEYGFVALITVFTGFINQFADAGLSYIIIRSDYNRLFQSTIHYLAIIIGIILAAIVIILAYPISLFYDNPALILPTVIMSSNFILRSCNTVPHGILAKALKFNKIGFIELVASITDIALMILLAYLKFSYWALIIPSVIANILRIVLYNANTQVRLKFLKRKYLIVGFRKAKSIIGNLTAFNLLNYWARNADNLVIGKVFGAQSLGIYNRAYKILYLSLNVMTNLFGKVLYPSLKDLSAKGGDVNKEYMNTLGIISLMSLPLSILLVFFSEPLVRFLWSERWIQVAELLPYIGILILTQTLNSTTGNVFILKGKERTLMLLGIPTSIVIIGAIITGSFFSVVHVMRFYTIASVAFDIPLTVYFGFKRSFGYDTNIILRFWIPKIFLSGLLIVSVWIDNTWLSGILIAIYSGHLLIEQKDDIFSMFKVLTRRLKNKIN